MIVVAVNISWMLESWTDVVVIGRNEFNVCQVIDSHDELPVTQ